MPSDMPENADAQTSHFQSVCLISRYHTGDLFLITGEWYWEIVFESGIAVILILGALSHSDFGPALVPASLPARRNAQNARPGQGRGTGGRGASPVCHTHSLWACLWEVCERESSHYLKPAQGSRVHSIRVTLVKIELVGRGGCGGWDLGVLIAAVMPDVIPIDEISVGGGS